MKASIRRNYCSPSQIRIEHIVKPIPKDNEVLIRVYATTVNRTDFAGKVDAIGKNVKSYRIVDKVFGFNDTGSESQAEYIAALMKNVFPVPYNKEKTIPYTSKRR